MAYACMRSIASFVPKEQVSNLDFESRLDTSDEWITKRTGIKTRYFASEGQKSSDLGYEAALKALKRANLSAKDIDALIVATLSPDYLTMPSTACIIANKLGIENIPAFDISAACSGFIYLLSLAKAFIESNTYKNILIIGAEKISSILDFSDRSTCILFGDGAGASVISATDSRENAILDVHLGSNGTYKDLLCTPRPHTEFKAQNEFAKPFVQMKGNEIFKLAVRTLSADVKHILDTNKLNASDITHFIPHQANLRIINAVGEMLNFLPSQIVITVQKYGNTSAASIPMAINDIYEQGKLKKGDLMLLDAFGGGLTWGSALVHFAGESI